MSYPLGEERLGEPEGLASAAELVQLAAVDSELFERAFFSKTVRQPGAGFHKDIWRLLDGPARYVNIEVFRGGAKTTKLRVFTAKRIAYSLSRTILYIGKSQPHARMSGRWIRMQVEENKTYSTVFGLRPGLKWTDEEMQILHGVDGSAIWVVAIGITGSVRGVNIDDYRPDTIIIDDVVDEENASTPLQREKIEQLVLGALKESLASAVEKPYAKLAILQTPQNYDDISQKALRDPQFVSARFGCWTKETEDLPLALRQSSWPEMFPVETLRAEYAAAAARNRLSIFAREMECKLITPETASFKAEWLQFFGDGEAVPEPALHEMWVEMAIDPVPPPSEVQIQRGLKGKDFEAFGVVGRCKGKYYVLETSFNRGHEPNWTISEFFRLRSKWRPRRTWIEAVAYQKTLEWILRQAMRHVGSYSVIEAFVDKRKKLDRIVDGLAGPASNGQLFVRRKDEEFISQFTNHPHILNDDVLEVVAVAVSGISRVGMWAEGMEEELEGDIPALAYERGAP